MLTTISHRIIFRALAMIVLLGLLPVVGLAADSSPHNPLTAEEISQGWISLFDGETLFGWSPATQTNWHVADGTITADEGEIGLLHTTSQFGDYRLKVAFRAEHDGNSGVFLRTVAKPADKGGRCYEVNIAPPRHGYPTGSIVGHAKGDVKPELGKWQSMDITAQGGHITVAVDGQAIVDCTIPEPIARGYIGLQFRKGKIEFRDIKLLPLGMKTLFDGKDLAQWNPPRTDSKSTFTVTPQGTLHVTGGRGMLETREQWGDFTLRTDAFIGGAGLNSGVFFRCIPGEVMNGYECQISNAYKDGDRTKPADCGTGGIFRRQDARKVVADDHQWFTLVLHVDGLHVAAWVNGYQVSDWTDARPADANPRKGSRLAPGPVQLQGHDPTTDFQFRRIEVAPLPGPRAE